MQFKVKLLFIKYDPENDGLGFLLWVYKKRGKRMPGKAIIILHFSFAIRLLRLIFAASI